jgi:hypothetical protein
MRVMPGNVLVLTDKKKAGSLILDKEDATKGVVHLSSSEFVKAGETVIFGDQFKKLDIEINGSGAYIMVESNIQLVLS